MKNFQRGNLVSCRINRLLSSYLIYEQDRLKRFSDRSSFLRIFAVSDKVSVGEPDLTELRGESAVQTAASLDLSSQEDVSCIFLPSFSHTGQHMYCFADSQKKNHSVF